MNNKKRGRPVVQEGIQKPRSVKLSDDSVKLAKRIGDGNMTQGIQLALDQYAETVNDPTFFEYGVYG